MCYVLEFFTIILPHPTKFCQYFILLIENFNLYSDEDGVKHIRIICLEHGVYVAEVPWAYPGSRFTKDFDLTVAWFASYLPRSTTSYFMRVEVP